ncbi:MAG: HEPN domain-containing protein, partial [bacterium]
MKTKKLAQIFVNDALIILDEAQQSFERSHWHRTVRKAQEAVELALKGLMRWTGVEYSKIHKIGKFFENPKLQALLKPEELRQFAAITDNLALKRELAFYGSDDMGAPELFDRDVAQKALD